MDAFSGARLAIDEVSGRGPHALLKELYALLQRGMKNLELRRGRRAFAARRDHPTKMVRRLLLPGRVGVTGSRCARTLVAVALATAIVTGTGRLSASSAAATAKHRAAAPKRRAKDLTPSFQKFCEQWMEKVWARESAGVLSWETDGDGVRGTYPEYSRDYTCTLTTRNPQVGKVNYRETRYEKRGKTVDEAQASAPTPVEIFDTDEYFTYIKGRWQ